MKDIRTESTIRPKAIDTLGDGWYYFNYDIIEYTKPDIDSKEITIYSFIQVKLLGTPNYADCVTAVIRKFISENEEFDIINSYNKYKLGLSKDKTIVDDYKNYLSLLDEIKENIKKEF